MAKAIDKWVRTKSDEAAVDDGCTFNLKAADRVREFFRKFLRHSKGEWAGKPFELLDWQWQGVIAPLFGWKRKSGTRRFRKAGVWVPKKNGKSALCSALSLYMLVGDREDGSECYNAAADRDQAGIVFSESANMIRASEALSSRIEVVPSQKRINFPQTNSWLKALSADVPTKEGLNWHLLVFDEIHAQKKRDLWDTLAYGGAARRQPLLLSISTAGYDRDGIGYEQYSYAKSVLEGRSIDASFFAYVSEAGPEADWKDPSVWADANPSLGVTIKAEDLEEACKEAQNSPAKENSFRRYRLNQWTEQDVRWVSIDKWDQCNAPLREDTLTKRDCYLAWDLSARNDTTALGAVFPDDDGTYDVKAWCWVPESATKDRERMNRTRFDEWIRRGNMIQIPGNVIDNSFVRAKIKELDRIYRVVQIGYDGYNSTDLALLLKDEDGFGERVVKFLQNFSSYTAPTKELERLVLEQKLRHGGDPVMRWQAGNLVVKYSKEGNVMPTKERALEKIDIMSAIIMALGLAMTSLRGSVYDTRGILTLDSKPAPAKSVEPDAALVVETAKPWWGWGDDDED